MPHVPRLICARCHHEMAPRRNGVMLEAMKGEKADEPYYKVGSDLWGCCRCDTEVYIPATLVTAESYQPGYNEVPAKRRFTFR